MRTVLVVLVLASMLALGTGRRRRESLGEPTQAERTTVADANHFSSQDQKVYTGTLSDIEKEKPIVFYLKPKANQNTEDQTLNKNPATVTLGKTTCTFSNYTQLCYVEEVTTTELELKVECKETPCDVSWMVLQPPKHTDGQPAINQLVTMSESQRHAVLQVRCDNPELQKSFGDSLNLYTNSNYEKYVSKVGLVVFLFSSEKQGGYLLTAQDQKTTKCANATLKRPLSEIKFNQADTLQYDFVGQNDSVTYQLPMPEHDFRVDFSAHDVAMQVITQDTGLTFTLSGTKGGSTQQLRKVPLIADQKEPFLDFSVVFKKPVQSYEKLSLQIQGKGRHLIIQSSFSDGDSQEVELGEQSYFNLKKEEKISYKLVPLSKDITNIQNVYIFVEGKGMKSSQSACGKQGCEFTIEASEDGQGSIYLGETSKADKAREEVIVEEFNKTVTKKVRQGEELFYSYKMKDKKAIQLLVNTPNVIVYAAAQSQCKQVDQVKCYQEVFTSHHPVIYQPKKDDTLLLKVIALDHAQFTITVMSQNDMHASLQDGVPFAYLLDDREEHLILTFHNPGKKEVSFNLISPVNELVLSVFNQNNPKKLQSAEHRLSSEGYILYKADEIQNEHFTIAISKSPKYKQKYVHFTIIASTKQSNLRLEAGLAHYETIPAQNTVDYVFEYQPDKQTLLNFYTHNQQHSIDISLTVSNVDEYDKVDKAQQLVIDSETDVLDLSLVSEKLCGKEQEQQCELFVRLKNRMQVELDVTVTLLLRDSIIELKDGIWQGYSATEMSATSHFWFSPHHQNHSTTIFYKSTMTDLRISYVVWENDDQSINQEEWPFPVQFKKNNTPAELSFKPLHFIHIEPKELTKCWPNCIVLLSIVPDLDITPPPAANSKDEPAEGSIEDILNPKHRFKIMASNNYVQLPEKHKVELVMTKGEQKQLLVDLKYYLEKEEIVFNTYQSLGKTTFKVNVHSQMHPRCPNNEDDPDFSLTGLETALLTADIKAKMSENSMDGDKNLYLCILAQSQQYSKFSIDFTSDTDGVKQLALDSSVAISLQKDESRTYHLLIQSDFYLKATREEGFPYIATQVCKKAQMEECLTKFTESEDKGRQLAEKVWEVPERPCQGCILMIKVTAEEPAKLTLHPTSKFGEFELVENHALYDILNADEQNRYQITGNSQEEIVINFQVQSGGIKVQVKDFSKVDVTKTSEKSSFHITIPPEDLQAQKQLGSVQANSFAHSSFRHLHVIVTSSDSKKGATYTITHSSGEPVLFLQDGLIAQYELIPKKLTKFIYNNPTRSSIYLHLSAPDAGVLSKIKANIFAMDDPEDEDSGVEMTPEKADFGRKTPNPTQLMQLPAKQNYLISLTNNANSNVTVSIGVNNRQIIYLPFDHDFPVQLGMGEVIYVVVPCPNPGYLHITLRKCDESSPYLGYTFNHTQFTDEDFDIEQQVTDELTYDLILKVKPNQQELYLKVRSHVGEKSLLTLKAAFSPNKIAAQRAKAGDKGLIKYQLLDSTKAELTFTSLVCAGGHSNCNKDFSYQVLSSNGAQNVIAQLVCSSVAFDLPGVQQLKAPKSAAVPAASSAADHKVTVTQEIVGDVSWVGVKAVSKSTGEVVYYRPVQIVTFWGQVQRSKVSTLIIVTILLCVFGTLGLVLYRRINKPPYRPLLNDNLD